MREYKDQIKIIRNCTRCSLSNFRTNIVLYRGNPKANIMILGEAPGCIGRDSLIEVAFRDKGKYPEGIPIKDLVGKTDLQVYSFDTKNSKLVLGDVKRVWKTGRKKLYRVTYEWKFNKKRNSITKTNSLDVSSNHPFLLKAHILHDPYKGINSNELYLSIDSGLSVGHSLQPFYRHENLGYSYIGISSKGEGGESRFLLENKIGRKLQEKEQCHHNDRSKLNDEIGNIEVIDIGEHAKLHNIEDGNCMHIPEVREKHKRIMRSKEYRSNMSVIMKEVLKDEKIYNSRIEQIQRSKGKIRETIKSRYKEPEFYYKYLLSMRKHINKGKEWVESRFRDRFPDVEFPPVDNHKIVSIEYIGEEDVYDMEVNKYNNFAVNGVFVHNSHEDLRGVPFVGPTGSYMVALLNRAGITMKYMYMTNSVLCRPPGNVDPTQEQMDACSNWLKMQIDLVNPHYIIAVGRIAASRLIPDWDIKKTSITREEGHVYKLPHLGGKIVIPIRHTSAIMRNPSQKEEYETKVGEVCKMIMKGDEEYEKDD
jgi:DNA polymerase